MEWGEGGEIRMRNVDLGFEGLMWHHGVRGSGRRSGDEGTVGGLKSHLQRAGDPL